MSLWLWPPGALAASLVMVTDRRELWHGMAESMSSFSQFGVRGCVTSILMVGHETLNSSILRSWHSNVLEEVEAITSPSIELMRMGSGLSRMTYPHCHYTVFAYGFDPGNVSQHSIDGEIADQTLGLGGGR